MDGDVTRKVAGTRVDTARELPDGSSRPPWERFPLLALRDDGPPLRRAVARYAGTRERARSLARGDHPPRA
jgi:hypothetical protein